MIVDCPQVSEKTIEIDSPVEQVPANEPEVGQLQEALPHVTALGAIEHTLLFKLLVISRAPPLISRPRRRFPVIKMLDVVSVVKSSKVRPPGVVKDLFMPPLLNEKVLAEVRVSVCPWPILETSKVAPLKPVIVKSGVRVTESPKLEILQDDAFAPVNVNATDPEIVAFVVPIVQESKFRTRVLAWLVPHELKPTVEQAAAKALG